MTRLGFLKSLKKAMKGYSKDTVKKTVDYYDEMISDRMEDGLSEEEAIKAMPAISEIISDLPEGASARKRRKLSAREIVLLILASPIWLPLLCAGLALIISLLAVIFSLVVSLFAVELSLAAGAVGAAAYGLVYLFSGDFMQALTVLGGALVMAGLALVLYKPILRLTRYLFEAAKNVCAWIKRRFSGKAVM